jgi:uncharacterized protein (UPF0335 family)
MGNNSKLKNAVQRLQSIDDQIKEMNTEKSDIYKELKGTGYNPKVVRKVLSILRHGTAKHEEEEAEIQSYLSEVS